MDAKTLARRLTLATWLVFIAGSAAAQPTVARDRAPAVPGSIRSFVDRLYSADAHARAEAACEIGRRHTDAAAAIPILLSMLSDDIVVAAVRCEMGPWALNNPATGHSEWSQTSPAKEAAEALGDIGEAAVPGLLTALGHADWKTRKFAAYGLGEAEPVNERGKVIAHDRFAGRDRDLAAVHRQKPAAYGAIPLPPIEMAPTEDRYAQRRHEVRMVGQQPKLSARVLGAYGGDVVMIDRDLARRGDEKLHDAVPSGVACACRARASSRSPTM
jgi:hypothetical protein